MRRPIGIFINSNVRCIMLPGLPISWNKNQYQEGTNEYVAVRPELKKQIEELYRKHPEEARDSFGEDPFEVKIS